MRLILSGDPLPLPVPPPSTFYRSETCRAHKHNFFSFLQLPKRAQTRTSPSPEMGESNNWTPLSRRSKSKRRRRVCGTRSKSSASEALGSSGGTAKGGTASFRRNILQQIPKLTLGWVSPMVGPVCSCCADVLL